MAQLVLFAIAVAATVMASSLAPDFGGPVVSLIAAAIIAGALAEKRTRSAMLTLMRAHRAALIAFIALGVVLILTSLGGGPDGGWRTRQALVHLALFALAGAGVGAIAGARGRGAVLTAAIAGAIGAAFLIVLGGGRSETAFGFFPPSLEAPALGAAYGMLAILCCFAAADELRRRPSSGGRTLTPLARRMFAPAAGLLTSFLMLILSGAPLALGATAVGLLAFTGALALRSRKSRVGLAVVPAAAFVSIAAAALAALTAGVGGGFSWLTGGGATAEAVLPASTALSAWEAHPWLGQGVGTLSFYGAAEAMPSFARLLGEIGTLGVITAFGVIGALLASMGLAKDRGRRMTRGFLLLAGVSAFAAPMVLASPAFSNAGPILILAALAGLAASYLDAPRPKAQAELESAAAHSEAVA